MTRKLCAHPAQLLNFTVSKFCYSSYIVIISLYNSKILLSLHYFLTPQFQTFTNLLFRIFGVSNPTFLSFLRNYASIIINVISNNTVLQCYLLWIFVSIRRLLQLIVSTTPPPPQPSPLLNLQTIQAPLFTQFTCPLLPKIFFQARGVYSDF